MNNQYQIIMSVIIKIILENIKLFLRSINYPITLYRVRSLSKILRIGATEGAKKFASLAKMTPLVRDSSSSVVAGSSSWIHDSIHLKRYQGSTLYEILILKFSSDNFIIIKCTTVDKCLFRKCSKFQMSGHDQ